MIFLEILFFILAFQFSSELVPTPNLLNPNFKETEQVLFYDLNPDRSCSTELHSVKVNDDKIEFTLHILQKCVTYAFTIGSSFQLVVKPGLNFSRFIFHFLSVFVFIYVKVLLPHFLLIISKQSIIILRLSSR